MIFEQWNTLFGKVKELEEITFKVELSEPSSHETIIQSLYNNSTDYVFFTRLLQLQCMHMFLHEILIRM